MSPSSAIESHLKGIGKNVLVKGQILSREDLLVEGQVEGTIDMQQHRLTVAPSANLHANVNAREVELRGTIEGQVQAGEKVFIHRGAAFIGDLRSSGLIIEDGGYVKGSVDLSSQNSK